MNDDLLNLDRRRFLAVAIACLSGSVLPEAQGSVPAAEGAAAPWQALFANSTAAVAVGRQYLRQHPQEASVPWLTDILFGTEQSMEKIRVGRQRDFRDGDVVVIDGWYFARTEARLLALLSMHTA